VDEPAIPSPPGRDDPSDDVTPELDPAVDAQVRDLLANVPDPGPMPEHVAGRIEAALAQAARLRVDPGPLTGSGTDAAHPTPDEALGANVLALRSRPNRPRPLHLAAAVAAAIAVVAAGASALQLSQRPNGAAIIGDSFSSPASTGSTSDPGGSGSTGRIHIQLSTTAYDAGTLATRARELLDHPAAPIRDLAAEAPHLGPIATPIGLRSCLTALGVADPAAVTADLGTYEGKPAAIIVVTRDGSATAWAVERSCSEGQPGILEPATPVP